jgi:hypothetical protein
VNWRAAVLGALVATGCASAEMALDVASLQDTGAQDTETTPRVVALRVDVYPAALQADGGDYRALPQSLGRYSYLGDGLDFGILELRRPVPILASVVGTQLGPSYFGPELPGTETSIVEASVRIVKADSVQDYTSVTDLDGAFEMFVVPQESYRVEIVPSDPRMPTLVQDLQVESSAPLQEFDVGAGIAIFGTVRDTGAPLAGASVAVLSAEGVLSSSALTDAQGNYELRVQPGRPYAVVCGGRAFELDPILSAGPVEVGDIGIRQDFVYPTASPVLVEGRVEDANGSPLGNVTVRFTSASLSGYGDVEHSTVVEVVTSNDGQFARRLLAGVYSTEFLPAPGEQPRDDQSPLRLDEIVVRGGAYSLPTQRLSNLATLDGRAVDPSGNGVPGTRISCAELDFTKRTWSTVAADGGFFELRVSRVPARCTLTPPGDRLDLPYTVLELDPEGHEGPLAFEQGVPVRGTVLVDGQPEAFAFVELTDEAGIRFGSALTRSDGTFEVSIARP